MIYNEPTRVNLPSGDFNAINNGKINIHERIACTSSPTPEITISPLPQCSTDAHF